MKHLKYLSYVLRHKWFVFQGCLQRGLLWRGLVHDLSKFLPSEWFPYVEHFYGIKRKPWRDKTGYYKPTDTGDLDFDQAWLFHQHRNDHHWQFWCLTEDDTGKAICLPMPHKAVLEMVSDWCGAGRAQGKQPGEVHEWYAINKGRMHLHADSRTQAEMELAKIPAGAEVKLPE